jgi:hypothetical protein
VDVKDKARRLAGEIEGVEIDIAESWVDIFSK